VKPREVIAILRRNGFVERKSKRGHRQFVRTEPPPKRRVTVPVHPGDLYPKTMRSIIVQSGKSADEFQ
jgi:predicted RNA binding protein YcfA (HicA-like mRNA interferase family)